MTAAPQPQQNHSRGEWAVGCKVTLSTTLGEVVSGEVFAYDHQTKCLVIRERKVDVDEADKVLNQTPSSGSWNARIINASFIKEVLSAERPSSSDSTSLSLPVVDLDRCEKREKRSLEDAQKRAELIGIGVTREAQSVFEALAKTMPCKWDETKIIVLGEVTIESPYLVQNCSAAPGSESTLDRVKKVLVEERKKLQPAK